MADTDDTETAYIRATNVARLGIAITAITDVLSDMDDVEYGISGIDRVTVLRILGEAQFRTFELINEAQDNG